jgi:hypothetical protein
MTTKEKRRRVVAVREIPVDILLDVPINGIYQVDSGKRLYEMAKKIAALGLNEYITSNPPPPPFRRTAQ